ncbi:procathepsin L isoform X7 [Astyanax mexicanus]|uniref:Cathepsin L1-like n=1 Tax=Astyanax mexicanus TaxID=7994 RepID=A0A8T2L8H4_ASTMX|nr:procathepsin L isoform X7 [Astyanax mexicanus]KAG9268258.1 cathepsin L1-like [Astyanax mexicanus]
MRVLLTVTTLVAVVSATSVSLEDLEFQEWKLKYGKSYDSEEEESQRKMIWMTNLKLVLEHNMLADQGLKTYRLGMNHFADMDDQEYQQMFRGYLRPSNRTKPRSAGRFLQQAENVALPYSIDWRDNGYVSDVKTQGHCASCWAFSAAGALEGQMFRKTGSLVSLSTQQLVDCSWLDGNDGCGGGSMELAFEYISRSGGLQTESDYPYKAREGMCMFNPQNVSGKCHDFEELPKGEEKDLQKAVVAVGPVSVAIDSSNKTFLLYQSGIYNEPYCSSYNVNHGVLVVGYNTDSSGREYWVVKNSWGVQWGEQGYIRMSRNKDNQCGIATRASFPLV